MIALRDAVTTSVSAGNSSAHVVDLPDHVAGDWVGVLISQSNDPDVTYTAPTDWNEPLDATDNSGNYGFMFAWTRAPAGGLGATATFTASSNTGFRANAVSYLGVDVDAIDAISAIQVNAAGTAPSSPSIDTVSPDALVIRLLTADDNDTVTAPSGTDERANISGAAPPNGSTAAWSDAVQATAGSTGTAEWTISSNEESQTATVALTPAVEAPPINPTLNEFGLLTIRAMRDNIAPGASGWDPDVEGNALEELIASAQAEVGVREDSLKIVRDDIFTRLEAELGPATSARDLELGILNRGQLNSSLIAIESDLEAAVDADNLS